MIRGKGRANAQVRDNRLDPAAMPSRRAPRPLPSRRVRRDQPPPIRLPGRRALVAGAGTVVAIGLTFGSMIWIRGRPERLRSEAESASRAGNPAGALDGWRAFHRVGTPTAATWLGQARAALALDRGAEADRALAQAIAIDPSDAEPWRLRLERLWAEDRGADALRLGRLALNQVDPDELGGVLRALTVAVFAEMPDDQARDRLNRWIAADPDDVDARIALGNRTAAMPRSGDPDRGTRIHELQAILDRDPEHLFARESLTAALAEAGEAERVRILLDAWPESGRDARYDQIRGRWDLDHAHQPARAVASFRRACAAMPHDWKVHYGLARALHALGEEDEARREAETVSRLRELLDPATLGPRLTSALRLPDDPHAAADLAALCDRAGLPELARAWHQEAQAPPGGGSRRAR